MAVCCLLLRLTKKWDYSESGGDDKLLISYVILINSQLFFLPVFFIVLFHSFFFSFISFFHLHLSILLHQLSIQNFRIILLKLIHLQLPHSLLFFILSSDFWSIVFILFFELIRVIRFKFCVFSLSFVNHLRWVKVNVVALFHTWWLFTQVCVENLAFQNIALQMQFPSPY